MRLPEGLNIEVTSSQYDYLYELVMMAYELDVPDQKGWDMQTYDNLVDNVCNARTTYLSETVKDIMNLYEEILKCYEGETEEHANTSFEFGLMNDLYYQLFYGYRDES